MRSLLMLGAVALAASLVVAVSCTMASAQASVERNLRRFLGHADARIIHPANGRFDAGLRDRVASWPDVTHVTGRLYASVIVMRPGAADGPRLAPGAIGLDFARERDFRSFEITDGRLPIAEEEVLIDPLLAEGLELSVGDRLRVDRYEDPYELLVAGIYRRQRLGTLQRPRIYLDRDRLQRGTRWEGELSAVYIRLAPGVDVAEWCARHADDVPEMLVLEPAEMVRTGFDQRVAANRIFLTVSTVLTFLSASFIVLLAMTTSLTEGARDLALLRCVGARRGQLLRTQLLVGGAVGLGGVLVGLPLGLLLAATLTRVFRESLPAGLVVDGGGMLLAAGGAIVAGIAGALYPALVAARTPPLQGLSRAAWTASRRQLALATLAALALIGTQVFIVRGGDAETRFWLYTRAGLPAMLTGWFLLGVPILILLRLTLAPALSRLMRVPGGLLHGSLAATPFRHGLTAGALMMGMTLLVSTYASTQAVRQGWFDQVRFADAFAMQPGGIDPRTQRAIADLPFVERTCPIGYLPARIVGEQVFGFRDLAPRNAVLVGFDPEAFFAMNAVDWLEGDPAIAIPRLEAGDAAIVAERFLIAKGIGVGDAITLGVGRRTREFEIVGVVSSAGLDLATQLFGVRSAYMDFALSCVFVDFETVGEAFDNHDAYMLQVNLMPGTSDEDADRGVLEAAPGVMFRNARWIGETIDEIARGLAGIHAAIAFAALGLAAIAVGHVLAAGVHGRRYEYGVVRAVGGSRGVLTRLILAEAIMLAVAGAVVGTLAGLNFAALDLRNLRDLAGLPVSLVIPWTSIAFGTGALVAVTLLAALPAAVGVMRKRPATLVALGRND
ncbi:MAG: ABC transporter permease [Phycisphaerales bacterium]|nr:ABC transporter permease [Phycisphaerales bacterium]